MERGRFRADLHNLLAVLPIEVPSLHERRDDIPPLIAHFLSVHGKRHRKTVAGLSGGAYDALLRYAYPGNVRELSNLIERGLIFAEAGAFIEINHIFTSLEKLPEMARTMTPHLAPGAAAAQAGRNSIETLEIELLRAALVEADWNVSQAARSLGLSRPKLDYRIRKFGLSRPAGQTAPGRAEGGRRDAPSGTGSRPGDAGPS
jgi:DNA-binding NtrC family response regulator